MQAATSGKGFSQVQETIEIVSLMDGMDCLLEVLNTDYSRNSMDPIEREDEMMGYAKMIRSLLEDTDFLLVKERRNSVQEMMHIFEELNTDYSCDSTVERYDNDSGELNAHHDVLAKKKKTHCGKRGLGAQSERVKCLPSSPAKADVTDALDAVHVAQKTLQELHNGQEPDRPTSPDEAVASSTAVQAVTLTSQDLAKKNIVSNNRRRWPGSRR